VRSIEGFAKNMGNFYYEPTIVHHDRGNYNNTFKLLQECAYDNGHNIAMHVTRLSGCISITRA